MSDQPNRERTPLHHALDAFGKKCDALDRARTLVAQAHERIPALEREVEEAVADLAALGVPVSVGGSSRKPPPGAISQAVCAALGEDGSTVDALVETTGFPRRQVAGALQALLRAGRVARIGSGKAALWQPSTMTQEVLTP